MRAHYDDLMIEDEQQRARLAAGEITQTTFDTWHDGWVDRVGKTAEAHRRHQERTRRKNLHAASET